MNLTRACILIFLSAALVDYGDAAGWKKSSPSVNPRPLMSHLKENNNEMDNFESDIPTSHAGTSVLPNNSESELDEEIIELDADDVSKVSGGNKGDNGDNNDDDNNKSSGGLMGFKSVEGIVNNIRSNIVQKKKSDSSQNNFMKNMKGDKLSQLWLDMMEMPPTVAELQDYFSVPDKSKAVNASDSVKSRGFSERGKETLYRDMLRQFLSPLNMTGSRTLWLDTEFALNLRGLGVMALQPERCFKKMYTDNRVESSGDTLLSRVPEISKKSVRAIRLSAPSGTHFIQMTLARALAHSLNARVIVLDSSTLDNFKTAACSENIPKKSLTNKSIFNSLLQLSNKTESPTVIVLQGRPKWLFENGKRGDELLSLLTNDFGINDSKNFFIMTQPNNALKGGKPVLSSGGTTNRETSSDIGFANVDSNRGEGNEMPGANMFGMPFGNFDNNRGEMPEMPPLPPGVPIPVHVIARIVVRNGTAYLGLSSGVPLSTDGQRLRGPLQELIQQNIRENRESSMQASFQFMKNGPDVEGNSPRIIGPVSLPDLPIFTQNAPQEAIMNAMRSPENMVAMNQFLERLMNLVLENMPPPPPNFQPGMGDSDDFLDNIRPLPAGIEIISHQGGEDSEKYFEIKVHLLAPPSLAAGLESFNKNIKEDEKKPDAQDHMYNNDAFGKEDDAYSLKYTMVGVNPDPNYNEKPGRSTESESKSLTETEKIEQPSMGTKAQRLLSRFEEVIVKPPMDQSLRSEWDQIVSNEVRQRICRFNMRLLKKHIQRYGLAVEGSTFARLKGTLSTNILTQDEVVTALNHALQLQAGSTDCLEIPGVTITPALPEDPEDKVSMSYWALNVALSVPLKLTVAPFGRASHKAKEDLMNKNLDKYEKALTGNIISPHELGVTYDMIGGLNEAKESLRQCITYPLKYPWLYKEGIAQEAVKGVLLFGPPGTGKTMLAKAVATEGGATFLSIDASTIENKWLGESEKNAKAVFTLARQMAPCVIYLDEVDSILSSREQGDDSSHGTLTSVKTTLMQEWDGLKTTKDRVVVIASTNRPFDLDEAVLRRLPRRILVDLPDLNTRKEIMEVALAGNRLNADVNLTSIATQLEGYSGSDIKEICREAVVSVSHEQAMLLEQGVDMAGDIFSVNNEDEGSMLLRAVCTKDFKLAAKKLKASVNDNGREMTKVIDWNAKYGEIKDRKKKNKIAVNMYI